MFFCAVNYPLPLYLIERLAASINWFKMRVKITSASNSSQKPGFLPRAYLKADILCRYYGFIRNY